MCPKRNTKASPYFGRIGTSIVLDQGRLQTKLGKQLCKKSPVRTLVQTVASAALKLFFVPMAEQDRTKMYL